MLEINIGKIAGGAALHTHSISTVTLHFLLEHHGFQAPSHASRGVLRSLCSLIAKPPLALALSAAEGKLPALADTLPLAIFY
jgi:hypothetical protein